MKLAGSRAFGIALICLFFSIYLLLARFALHAFPFSGDEYSYLLQAQLFARGMIKAPAPPHPELYYLDHVVIDDFVRSKYPPGTSALLALGVKAGAAWVVTPVEALITLIVVWRTVFTYFGARGASVSVVVLGLAPLFVFQAATFYSQTATTMFLAVAFAAIATWSRTRETKKLGWLVVAGLAIGCAFTVRPFDAVVFGAAMLVFKDVRAIVVTALSAVPLLAANLVYNRAQWGSPFADGYHAFEPTYRIIYGEYAARHAYQLSRLVDPVQQWHHVDIVRALALEWTVPATVVLAAVGAYSVNSVHIARGARTFAVSLVVAFLVTLLPMVADPDDGARARYLSVLLVPLAFLAAPGFPAVSAFLADKLSPRARTVAVAVAVALAPAQLASFLWWHMPKVWLREGVYQAVKVNGVHNSVVVVRAQYPSRYARNGPFFDHDVLYLSALQAKSIDEIAPLFPDREVWEATEGDPWTLKRVR